MKNFFFFFIVVFIVVGVAVAAEQKGQKVVTERGKPVFQAVTASDAKDTCPGQDIYQRFSCGKDQPEGFTCTDAYMIKGMAPAEHRYELVEEKLTPQDVSAEPQCPAMCSTCEAFLKSLNYNLEFSWYLENFPSSSYPQCSVVYDCRRIMCYFPVKTEGAPDQSMQLSCVYKGNRAYFVATEVVCGRE